MSPPHDTTNLRALFEPLLNAEWMVGGALRFDDELLALHSYLRQYFAPRQLRHVTATPPCLWSLDWLGQRALSPDALLVQRLRQYNEAGIAVSFCFDNAFIPAESIDDDYGIGLVEELSKSPLNSLWIASDALRDHLRAHYPRLPLYAHPNRIASERQRRTAALYQRLAERYDRVALHPRDGARREIYAPLAAEASRYIIIANDRCLSTCPLRREHLQQLSLRRQQPYQTAPRLAIAELIQRCDCKNAIHTLQGKRGNLSQQQLRVLYELGFRRFALLDQQTRSVGDLIHDFCHYSFNQSPDFQHLLATLTVTLYSLTRVSSGQPRSGMSHVRQIPDPKQVAF